MNRIAFLLAILSVLAFSVGLLLVTGSTTTQAIESGAAGTVFLVAVAAYKSSDFAKLGDGSFGELLVVFLVLAGIPLISLLIDGAFAGVNPFSPHNWSLLFSATGPFGFIVTVCLAYFGAAAMVAITVHRVTLWLLRRLLPQLQGRKHASEA